MPEAIYCELCGNPISGKSYKITIEGVSLTVCEKCYMKQISKQKATQSTESPKMESKKVQHPVKKVAPKKSQEVEFEVVEDYATRIRNAREKMGLTLMALSQKVMEKETVLKRIEQGRLRPSLELSRRLEKALGIRLLEPVVEDKSVESKFEKESNIEDLTLGDVVNLRKK